MIREGLLVGHRFHAAPSAGAVPCLVEFVAIPLAFFVHEHGDESHAPPKHEAARVFIKLHDHIGVRPEAEETVPGVVEFEVGEMGAELACVRTGWQNAGRDIGRSGGAVRELEGSAGGRHLSGGKRGVVNPDFVDQAIQRKHRGELLPDIILLRQGFSLADLQVACRWIDALLGGGLICGKAPVDVKANPSCGLIIDAGEVIPAAAFEELAGLDPDRLAAGLDAECHMPVRIDPEVDIFIFAELDDGRPIPRIGGESHRGFDGESVGTERNLLRGHAHGGVVSIKSEGRARHAFSPVSHRAFDGARFSGHRFSGRIARAFVEFPPPDRRGNGAVDNRRTSNRRLRAGANGRFFAEGLNAFRGKLERRSREVLRFGPVLPLGSCRSERALHSTVRGDGEILVDKLVRSHEVNFGARLRSPRVVRHVGLGGIGIPGREFRKVAPVDDHSLRRAFDDPRHRVGIDLVGACCGTIAAAGGEFLERVAGFPCLPDRKIASGAGKNEAPRVSSNSLHNDVRLIAGAGEFFKILAGIDLRVKSAEFCGGRTK